MARDQRCGPQPDLGKFPAPANPIFVLPNDEYIISRNPIRNGRFSFKVLERNQIYDLMEILH